MGERVIVLGPKELLMINSITFGDYEDVEGCTEEEREMAVNRLKTIIADHMKDYMTVIHTESTVGVKITVEVEVEGVKE